MKVQTKQDTVESFVGLNFDRTRSDDQSPTPITNRLYDTGALGPSFLIFFHVGLEFPGSAVNHSDSFDNPRIETFLLDELGELIEQAVHTIIIHRQITEGNQIFHLDMPRLIPSFWMRDSKQSMETKRELSVWQRFSVQK